MASLLFLQRLLWRFVGSDEDNVRKEERADVNILCNVRELSRQLNPAKPNLIAQEIAKYQVLFKVQRYNKEGWPSKLEDEMKQFKKLADSLVVESKCLFLRSPSHHSR